MGLHTEASAALVYLILYAILFILLLFSYFTGRMKIRSRYTLILLHVTIRLASQGTGLAFGIVGYANTSLLVAYFVLGAEGYFSLVLCTYRFLISWQNHNFASQDSWLEPRYPPGVPWYKRFLDSFTLFGPRRRPMSIIHNLLIGANALIVTGGSLLVGGANDVSEFTTKTSAKAMRTAGQGIFLAINAFLLVCVLQTIRQSRSEKPGKGTHSTLIILLIAWPILFVRGLYGVLAGVVPAFNYFNASNYDETGLTDSFVISEYILGTTMEWCACTLLMITYLTSRNDPKKADLENKKGDTMGRDKA